MRKLVFIALLMVACATEVHDATCVCEIKSEENVTLCSQRHEERAYKKRPFLNVIQAFFSGLFGIFAP